MAEETTQDIELLWVKAGRNAGKGKVGLSEADDQHPPDPVSGAREIFVYDGGPAVLAAPTSRVLQALSEGKLALATEGDVAASRKHSEAIVARADAYRVAQDTMLGNKELPPTPPPPKVEEAPAPAPATPAGDVLDQLKEQGAVTESRKDADPDSVPADEAPAATPVGGRTRRATETEKPAE